MVGKLGTILKALEKHLGESGTSVAQQTFSFGQLLALSWEGSAFCSTSQTPSE